MNFLENVPLFIKTFNEETLQKPMEYDEEISIKWSWSQLLRQIQKQCVDQDVQFEDNELFRDDFTFYRTPPKRRDALRKLEASIETMFQEKTDVTDWRYDVAPLLSECFVVLRKNVICDEVVYMLQLHAYDVNEEAITLLKNPEGISVTIEAHSMTFTEEVYQALVFLNTDEAHNQSKFKETEDYFKSTEDIFRHTSLHDEHHSIIIIAQFPGRITLKEMVQRYSDKGEHVPKDVILKVFKQLLECIAHHHNIGYVHGRIHPMNIFVCQECYCTQIVPSEQKLRISPDDSYFIIPKSKRTSYEEEFMAPELLQSDGRSLVYLEGDIFAMGVILYELVTFKRYKVKDGVDLSEAMPFYDEMFAKNVENMLAEMLAKDKKDRRDVFEVLSNDVFKHVTIESREERQRLSCHKVLYNTLDSENVDVLGSGAFGKVKKEGNICVKVATNRESLEQEKELVFFQFSKLGKVPSLMTPIPDEFISPGLKMEICEQGDLESIFQGRKGQRYNELEAVQCMMTISKGVEHIHSIRIVHRDIKPKNLVMTSTNVTKLTDFNMSLALKAHEYCRGIAGTKPYIAPEICKGELYDQAADIWSLGLVFYFLLTLTPPEEDIEKVYHSLSSLSSHSDELKSLIASMLKVDPKERVSIDQILRKLSNILYTRHVNVLSTAGDDMLDAFKTIKQSIQNPEDEKDFKTRLLGLERANKEYKIKTVTMFKNQNDAVQ